MLLIATDEAGYGPKLGPLVIAGSCWRLPEPSDVAEDLAVDLAVAFSCVAGPAQIGGQRIVVDDSKAVFQPRSKAKSNQGAPAYGLLQQVVAAGCRWAGIANDRLALVDDLAQADSNPIKQAPWLELLAGESVSTAGMQNLVSHWQSGPAQLCDLQARVITASQFNQACSAGMNKSDLLSTTTLSLVRQLLQRAAIAAGERVAVFCDRHGGRRYYAGPLQAAFDGTLVQVIAESKSESRYRVPAPEAEFSISFTVKGDSFTPVAYSSMVAKYLREKAMESINAFFAERHDAATPLRPTAGYPVDADRFLEEIQPILQREKITREDLVRLR